MGRSVWFESLSRLCKLPLLSWLWIGYQATHTVHCWSTIVVKKLYGDGVVLASSSIVAVLFCFLYCIYCVSRLWCARKYNMTLNWTELKNVSKNRDKTLWSHILQLNSFLYPPEPTCDAQPHYWNSLCQIYNCFENFVIDENRFVNMQTTEKRSPYPPPTSSPVVTFMQAMCFIVL
jgi:hypothetical protein